MRAIAINIPALVQHSSFISSYHSVGVRMGRACAFTQISFTEPLAADRLARALMIETMERISRHEIQPVRSWQFMLRPDLDRIHQLEDLYPSSIRRSAPGKLLQNFDSSRSPKDAAEAASVTAEQMQSAFDSETPDFKPAALIVNAHQGHSLEILSYGYMVFRNDYVTSIVISADSITDKDRSPFFTQESLMLLLGLI